MPIQCPKCGMKHDVTEFSAEGGSSASGGEVAPFVFCCCGLKLDIKLMETVEDFLRFAESEEERKKAKEIQEDAQLICQMILDESSAEFDIELAKGKLREKVERYFPDKLQTYEMIYEARFKRLWEQFRTGPDNR